MALHEIMSIKRARHSLATCGRENRVNKPLLEVQLYPKLPHEKFLALGSNANTETLDSVYGRPLF